MPTRGRSLGTNPTCFAGVERVVVVAADAYHAGLLGKYAIERSRGCPSRWPWRASTYADR